MKSVSSPDEKQTSVCFFKNFSAKQLIFLIHTCICGQNNRTNYRTNFQTTRKEKFLLFYVVPHSSADSTIKKQRKNN